MYHEHQHTRAYKNSELCHSDFRDVSYEGWIVRTHDFTTSHSRHDANVAAVVNSRELQTFVKCYIPIANVDNMQWCAPDLTVVEQTNSYWQQFVLQVHHYSEGIWWLEWYCFCWHAKNAHLLWACDNKIQKTRSPKTESLPPTNWDIASLWSMSLP